MVKIDGQVQIGVHSVAGRRQECAPFGLTSLQRLAVSKRRTQLSMWLIGGCNGLWRTLDGVKHLLFGCKGGEFCGTDGKYLQVIDAVPAAAGVLAFSQ